MMLVVWVSVILISLTVHEFSHAYMATKKGDHTAELAGRLTLNPIAHIDPVGFIALLVLGFGWAKPVPFNPYNLEDPKKDALHIALAGPASNLLLAILVAVLFRAFMYFGLLSASSLLPTFFMLLILVNLFLMIFNLVPIYPLDGSSIIDILLTKPEHQKLRMAIMTYGPQMLFILVLASLVTDWNVFFFVSEPAYAICNLLTGGLCY